MTWDEYFYRRRVAVTVGCLGGSAAAYALNCNSYPSVAEWWFLYAPFYLMPSAWLVAGVALVRRPSRTLRRMFDLASVVSSVAVGATALAVVHEWADTRLNGPPTLPTIEELVKVLGLLMQSVCGVVALAGGLGERFGGRKRHGSESD